jgi:hypothetical protein
MKVAVQKNSTELFTDQKKSNLSDSVKFICALCGLRKPELDEKVIQILKIFI